MKKRLKEVARSKINMLHALSRSLFLAILLSLTGCAAFSNVSTLTTTDLQAFQATADKYGTPSDQYCAKTLSEQWTKLDELLSDKSGALIALTYRSVLANRLAKAMEQMAVQNCGGLAAEIAVAIGQAGAKFAR